MWTIYLAEELATAIIIQAVEDYRKAKELYEMYPLMRSYARTIRECERFFRSEWFTDLVDIGGETLRSRLERMNL